MLGDGDAAITEKKQTGTDDERGSPFDEGRFRRALPERDEIHDDAGEKKADPGHEQWRHRLDSEENAEVGRAPDQIDGREGGDDQEFAVRRRRTAHEKRSSVHGSAVLL